MAEIIESLIVTPYEETPRQKIWLSNLDLVAARNYTPTIYLYPNATKSNLFSTETLKTALAKTLVIFHPLAGRLSRDPQTGRMEIDCNGRGVLFVVAKLNATVDDFVNFAPSTEMQKKLLPSFEIVNPPCPLTMFQMTRLSCGGIVIGFANHHCAVDGTSAYFFIRTFCNFARGDPKNTIPPPFFDRTLLRARSPPTICFDHSDYFLGNLKIASVVPSVTANLTLSKQQIHMLKVMSGGERVSTFRAVVAHVWKCSCIARGLASDVETEVFLPIDLRARLKPALPPTYFGNPTMRTKATGKVEDIMSRTLEFGANLLKNATDKVTNEFARSLIDKLESMDLEALCKRGSLPTTSLMAISWLGIPLYDADFGWGPPALMARASMYGAGSVYLTRVPELDGGISVILSLEPDSMIRFKQLFHEKIDSFSI